MRGTRNPARRKTRPREHVIADMSVHYLSYIVVKEGFIVEQKHSDYGIDLSVFTFSLDGQYENANIWVQLKATDSIKTGRDGFYRQKISRSEIATWERETFPVFLVLFDAQREECFALHLQEYFSTNGISSSTMKSESRIVRLPPVSVTGTTIQNWRSLKNKMLEKIGEMVDV